MQSQDPLACQVDGGLCGGGRCQHRPFVRVTDAGGELGFFLGGKMLAIRGRAGIAGVGFPDVVQVCSRPHPVTSF